MYQLQQTDPLLTTKQVARVLNLAPSTLATWRVRKSNGPKLLKLGGAVRYRLSDLYAFTEGREQASTSV